MFIFNQGMKDELMIIVYHEKTKEAEHEANEEVVGDLGNCEDQLIDFGEQMKYNERNEITPKKKK